MEGGLHPNVVLEAVDTDVIKTYVRLGFGIGIISSPAYNLKEDSDLIALDGIEMFQGAVTQIVFRPGTILRGYMHDFIETFAPHLKRELVSELVVNEQQGRADELLGELVLPFY